MAAEGAPDGVFDMRMLGAALIAAMALWATPALAEDSVAAPLSTPSSTPSSTPQWRLVWNDEFDGAALDATKWRARVTPRYHPLGDTDFDDTPRFLRVEGGVLKLIARRAPHGRYASAMVETQDIAAWEHGRYVYDAGHDALLPAGNV